MRALRGKLANGFDITPGVVGSLVVMLTVLLMREAGRAVVIGKLETMESRRRGPVGGEESVGKPSADTRGGDGSNVNDSMPK